MYCRDAFIESMILFLFLSCWVPLCLMAPQVHTYLPTEYHYLDTLIPDNALLHAPHLLFPLLPSLWLSTSHLSPPPPFSYLSLPTSLRTMPRSAPSAWTSSLVPKSDRQRRPTRTPPSSCRSWTWRRCAREWGRRLEEGVRQEVEGRDGTGG